MELQQEINADPKAAQEEELNRYTTFLKRPERPIPKARLNSQSEDTKSEAEVEPYRVVIKKQPKKSVTERLLQQGLIEPSRLKTPEPTPVAETPEPSEVNGQTFQATWSFDYSESLIHQVGQNFHTWSFDYSVKSKDHELESRFNRADDIDLNEIEADAMMPINESIEEPNYNPLPTPPSEPIAMESYFAPKSCMYNEIVPSRVKFVPEKPKKMKFCRRGRYAKKCLNNALESFKTPSGKTKPTLLKRAHYFERIVGDIKKSLSGEKDDSFVRLLLLTTLAYSLRDTYDAEILHRGSSRRNSRRLSYARRESNVADLCPYENGYFVFRGRKDSENLKSFQSKCAEGRRRLSVMGMVVADKINHAMHTDIARGLAYAMVPCASALAFFMFNYAKRFNDSQ